MAESSGDSSKVVTIDYKICQKSIVAKIKDFHIFWHVGKETECPTYSYKLCDYKHDKSANVKQHIASEHKEDVFAEDLITLNLDLVKEVIKNIFVLL